MEKSPFGNSWFGWTGHQLSSSRLTRLQASDPPNLASYNELAHIARDDFEQFWLPYRQGKSLQKNDDLNLLHSMLMLSGEKALYLYKV